MGVAIIASANFVGSNIFSGKKGNYPKKEFVFFGKNSDFCQKREVCTHVVWRMRS